MNVSVAPTEFTILFGFQPILYATASDVYDSCGVAMTNSVSAPEAFSCGMSGVTAAEPPFRG